MAREQRFLAIIQEGGRGGAAVMVPDEVVHTLGGGGRIPVQATFDGVMYRGSVVRMGSRAVLGVTKDIRADIGKAVGDEVVVVVDRDDEVRRVQVPDQLAVELSRRPKAQLAFEGLSYSHRREYVQWIEEAKKPETKVRRIRSTIERLEASYE